RLTFTRRKVRAIGMVEHQRAHARLRVHHHAVGEPHADIFGLQQLPEALLVVEVRARRITEAVALAAIARREPLLHGHGGWIGKAPVLTHSAMQPLRAALCGFDRQSLESVREEKFATLFGFFRTLADAFPR